MEKTINQEKLKQKRDSTLFLNKIYILGYFFFGVDFVLKKKVNLQMKKWIYRIKRITLNFHCFKVTSVRIISLYANGIDTAQKMKFPLRISSVNVTKSQFLADLVTFTEEIHDGKLHYLCSDISVSCKYKTSEKPLLVSSNISLRILFKVFASNTLECFWNINI